MASTYKTHTPQTDNTSFILKTMAMICLARGDGCESLKYHSLEGAVKVKTEWMIRKEICSVKPKFFFFYFDSVSSFSSFQS